MKRYILIVALIIMAGLVSNAYSQGKKKADKDTEGWRYEIEAVKEGTMNSYLIKVWSYSNYPEVAIEQAKKNAVHGIIFRGISGAGGVQSKPPLTSDTNLEQEQAGFFDSFFSEGGKYMKFVNLTNDGSVAAGDRLKIDKNTYKIGGLVSVNVGALRKDLEEAGIVRKLTSGF
jgi:hypothetical protein